jgi:hypothetical protein
LRKEVWLWQITLCVSFLFGVESRSAFGNRRHPVPRTMNNVRGAKLRTNIDRRSQGDPAGCRVAPDRARGWALGTPLARKAARATWVPPVFSGLEDCGLTFVLTFFLSRGYQRSGDLERAKRLMNENKCFLPVASSLATISDHARAGAGTSPVVARPAAGAGRGDQGWNWRLSRFLELSVSIGNDV